MHMRFRGSHVTRLLDHDDEDAPHHRRIGDDHAVVKNLGLIVAGIAIVGSVFTAGYNWRSVDVMERNQENFVRKDVQGQQWAYVNYQLQELSKQVEQLRAELEKRRP